MSRNLVGVPDSVPDIDDIWQILPLVAQMEQRHGSQQGGLESKDDHGYGGAEIRCEQVGLHSLLG